MSPACGRAWVRFARPPPILGSIYGTIKIIIQKLTLTMSKFLLRGTRLVPLVTKYRDNATYRPLIYAGLVMAIIERIAIYSQVEARVDYLLFLFSGRQHPTHFGHSEIELTSWIRSARATDLIRLIIDALIIVQVSTKSFTPYSTQNTRNRVDIVGGKQRPEGLALWPLLDRLVRGVDQW